MSTSQSVSRVEERASMRQSDEKKIRHKVLAPGITRHPFIRSGNRRYGFARDRYCDPDAISENASGRNSGSL